MPVLQGNIKRNTELGIQGQVSGNLHNRLDVSYAWGGSAVSVEDLFGRLVRFDSPGTVTPLSIGTDDVHIAGFVVNQRHTQNDIGFNASAVINPGDSVTVMQVGTLIVKAGEAAINSDPTAALDVDTDPGNATVGQLFQTTTPANPFSVAKWVTVVTVPDAVSLLMEISFNFDFRTNKL